MIARKPPERDQGSASVAMAIMFPAVGLLFLALVQAVMVSVARDVALASAEEGLQVARALHSTPAEGRAAAVSFARQEPVLQEPTVSVTGRNVIVVRVTGNAPSALPGVHISVARTARGARERFSVDTREFTNSGGASGTNPRMVSPDG